MIFGFITLTGFTFIVTGFGTGTFRALGTAFITVATGFSVTGLAVVGSADVTGLGSVSTNNCIEVVSSRLSLYEDFLSTVVALAVIVQ